MKTFFIGVLVAAALTRTGNAQLPSTEPPKTWIVLGGAFINLANIAKIEIPAGAEPLFYGPTSKTKLLSLNKGSDLMQLRLYIGRSPEWVTVPDKREPTREIYVNLNHVTWFMSAHAPDDNRLFLVFAGQVGGPELGGTDDPIIMDRITRWVGHRIVVPDKYK